MNVREQYRRDHPACQLCYTLGRLSVKKPRHFLTELQIHHIVGGSGRKDFVSNMLAVCPSCHAWCEQYPKENRIICLWLKLKAYEFNADEYHECSGMYAEGAIEKAMDGELLTGFTAVGFEVLNLLNGM